MCTRTHRTWAVRTVSLRGGRRECRSVCGTLVWSHCLLSALGMCCGLCVHMCVGWRRFFLDVLKMEKCKCWGFRLWGSSDSLPIWRLCLPSGLAGRVPDLILWDWWRLLPWAKHWRAWAGVRWHQVGIEFWKVGSRGILFSGDNRCLKTPDLCQQVVGPRRSKASSAWNTL